MLTAPQSQESKGDDTWTAAADRPNADWTTRAETPPRDAQWVLCLAPRFHEVTPVYTQAPPLSCHLAASDTPHQSAFLNVPAHGGEFCFFSRVSKCPGRTLGAWMPGSGEPHAVMMTRMSALDTGPGLQ